MLQLQLVEMPNTWAHEARELVQNTRMCENANPICQSDMPILHRSGLTLSEAIDTIDRAAIDK